jgi:hypothetical protein
MPHLIFKIQCSDSVTDYGAESRVPLLRKYVMQLEFSESSSSQHSAEGMLPLVIDESLVHSFNYWNQGVQKGMRYGNHLYAHVRFYALEQRSQAYKFGCEWAEKQTKVCITVAAYGYSVWVNLRSL